VIHELAVVAGFLVVAASLVVSGVRMIRAGRATSSAVFLLWTAALALCAAGVIAADGSDRAIKTALDATGYLGLAPAVFCYPRAAWRHPVDFVVATTLAAAGVLATLQASNESVAAAMGTVTGTVLLIHTWWTFERSDDTNRKALLWAGLAIVTSLVLATFIAFLVVNTLGAVIVLLIMSSIGPAMAIGVLRPDLVDVRGLIVQTVVYAVTMIVFVAAFDGVVSVMQSVADRTPSVGALAVLGAFCALGFRPTAVVLRGVIDQLLFGDRPDPLEAATRVADHIGDDPALALRAIREALVLPYASLTVEGVTLATTGNEVTHTRTLPLQLGGSAVGEIVVGLRAGELTLAAADEDVLRIVAPLLAQTLRARALARDLQESRSAAISAIEDERRRLRRDLHDGLGPTLSGVAFTTDAARNQLRSDPDGADELLGRLRADTSDAITEIRRLVEGLRPPTLDQLGLIAALRQHASSLYTAGGTPLVVTVTAPATLPELSAAVEVTAYRVIVEALTNVARHATATGAHVELDVEGEALRLSVQDDGRGVDVWQPGVGMSSMRERVEQVGGTLTAAPRGGGGRVEALIPLSSTSS
jgi:two-component system NarL family sensor kinase